MRIAQNSRIIKTRLPPPLGSGESGEPRLRPLPRSNRFISFRAIQMKISQTRSAEAPALRTADAVDCRRADVVERRRGVLPTIRRADAP